MFLKRQTEGSVICTSCGVLVGVNDERCDNCLYYMDTDKKLAYCWHPKLRILVGAKWWCQWWEKVEE